MLSRDQKRRIKINSLGLFLLSFFIVKISIIFIKFVVAKLFGVSVKIEHFRLLGISPPYSEVWTHFSVLSIYSLELLIPFILFVISFRKFLKALPDDKVIKIFYLWLGFCSLHSIFSSLISGIVTRSNAFHFLQWIYIPYFTMMIICIIAILFSFLAGWWYNKMFLALSPDKEFIDTLNNQKEILRNGLLIPAGSGMIILGILLLPHPRKYDLYDLLIMGLMVLPALLYRSAKSFIIQTQQISVTVYPKILWWAGILFGLFFILNLPGYFHLI